MVATARTSRGGYWPLVTPTLRFAMNTCVLNQTLLHESEEAFRQQNVRAKEVVGHEAAALHPRRRH